MRFGKHSHSFQKNPASFETRDIGVLSIEGDEGDLGGGGGSGGGEGGENQPFTVSAEDWQSAQSELAQLRERAQRFDGVERELGTIKERFKPFLQGGEGGQGSEDRAPDQNDTAKYPRTPEGAQRYINDLVAYQVRQGIATHQKTAEASRREQAEAAAKTERVNKAATEHMKRTAALTKEYADYDAVVSRITLNLQQHPELVTDILESEVSAHLEYYLAKNPVEAMQLARLYATNQKAGEKALWKLEHKFSEDAKKAAARKQAERAGGWSPTHSIEGENQPGGDDAADEDFVRGRLGLGAKK